MAHKRVKDGGFEKKPFFQLFSLLPPPPPPPPPTPPSLPSLSPYPIDTNHPKTIKTPSPLLWKPPELLKSTSTDLASETTPLAPPPNKQSHEVPNHELLSFTEKLKSPSIYNDPSASSLNNEDTKVSKIYSGSLSSPVKVFDKVLSKVPSSISPTQQDSVVSITVSIPDERNNITRAKARSSLSAPPNKRRSSTSYARNNSLSGFTSGRRKSSGTLSVPVGRENRTSSVGRSSSLSSSQSLSIPNSANGRRHSSSSQRQLAGSSHARLLSKSSTSSSHCTPSASPNCGVSFITDKRACGLGHSKFHHVTLRKLSSCPDSIGDTSSNNNKRMILKSTSGKRFWFRSQNSIILTNDNGFYSILDFKEMKCHWEIMKKRRSCLRLLLIVIRIRLLIQESRKKQTFQNKPQTLAELNYYSQYTAFSTKTMTFNKSEFAQKRSCNATIPLWARFAMEEDPVLRSPTKIKKLVSLFKHFSGFHESLTSSAQEEYCRCCQYTIVNERQVILKAGHPSYFSYLIISGSVFVNVEDEDPSNGKKCYRTTKILHEGALFGEVSLVQGLPRFANYIARERTELIVLDKEATVKLLAAGINKELSLKVQHIKGHHLFTNWPEDLISKLAGECETVSFPFNGVIDKDVSSSLFMYMILEGTVEILTPSTLGRAAKDFTTADQFTDLGVYQRLKVPNQCSRYRNLSLCDRRAFISLDLLTPYSICDVRSLLPSSLSANPHPLLILVSHGSKILKIPKHPLHCIPSAQWRQLIIDAKATPYYPSEQVFLQLHQEHLQWNRFKSLLTRDIVEEVFGAPLANKPSFLKGQCGWSKSKPPSPCPDCQFKECLSSDVPLCYHGLYRSCHDGCCILEYIPPHIKMPYNQRLATNRINY